MPSFPSDQAMSPNHLPTFLRLLFRSAAAGLAAWGLLATMTTLQALCQAVPAAVEGKDKTETRPAKEAPSARLASILKIQNIDQRQEHLIAFGIELGSTDPEVGMQMLQNDFPHILDRQIFWVPMLRYWAAKQPLVALAACQRVPGGEQRALAYASCLAGWAAAAPQEAAEWTVKNLSGIYRRTAIARIGKVWADTAPRKAAEWALTYSSEVDQVFSLTEVIETWADLYGYDAAEWCNQLPAGKLHDLGLSKAVFHWADYFPQTAAEWLIKHPDALWLLPQVAARWGHQDPAAASVWLDKNVNGAAAQECRHAMVMEWANYNAPEAFEWAEKAFQGSSREEIFSAIFSAWALEYPLEARLSALKLTDETERYISLESIFMSWGILDLEAFQAWLKKLQPGIEKDIGIEQMAVILLPTNPAAALSEVLSMVTAARRQRTLTQHYQDWKRNEPQAADAWLKDHPEVVKLVSP
jgi:hypothetical protein